MLPVTALVSCTGILCLALPAWVPGAGLTGVCGSSPAPSTARSPRSSVSLRMLMVVASRWMSWTAFLRPARSQEIKSVYVLDSTSIASLYACKILRRKHSREAKDALQPLSHGSLQIRLHRGVKLQHEKNSPCNSAPVPLTAATEILDINPITWGGVWGDHRAGSPTVSGDLPCRVRAGRQEGSVPAALLALVLPSYCKARQTRHLPLLLSFWPSPLGAARSFAAAFSYRKSPPSSSKCHGNFEWRPNLAYRMGGWGADPT